MKQTAVYLRHMTATPEEVREQVMDDALEGVSEIQIGDRRIKKMTPAERLDAVQRVEGATQSPFIKVGLKSREF